VVVDTDAAPFGGSGADGGALSVGDSDHAWQVQPSSALVDLPPLAVVWLAAHRPV
jgi:1,4-alpha-glucan branching enzyme